MFDLLIGSLSEIKSYVVVLSFYIKMMKQGTFQACGVRYSLFSQWYQYLMLLLASYFFPSQDIKQNVLSSSYLGNWWRHKLQLFIFQRFNWSNSLLMSKWYLPFVPSLNWDTAFTAYENHETVYSTKQTFQTTWPCYSIEFIDSFWFWVSLIIHDISIFFI